MILAAVAAAVLQPQTVFTVDPGHRLIEGIATDGSTIWLSSLFDRQLLAERFKLVAHTEQRETPIYSMVLARSDGRLGPNLQRVNDCAEARSRKPAESSPPSASGASGCGPIAVIASAASRLLGTPVVNNTGITGTFAYSLFYSTEAINVADLDVPSVPTALREQLGLKLEPARGSVDVLVIESVERPTPD